MPPETLKSLLDSATRKLAAAGSDSPGLDARLLLQHVSGISREDIILQPERVLSHVVVADFAAAIARRAACEPVSRILGEREFYGRPFEITPDVLDPRPDTEVLIDAALKLLKPGDRFLDLGTGSGAIAITLLAERPDISGLATDASPRALAVARKNAERLGVADRLDFAEGDWFAPATGRFGLIVSNPPYIPLAEIAGLSADVRDFDPLSALAGGNDGLDAYRAIAGAAGLHLEPGARVLVEIGAGQANDVEAVFTGASLRPEGRFVDLGGHQRCLSFAAA